MLNKRSKLLAVALAVVPLSLWACSTPNPTRLVTANSPAPGTTQAQTQPVALTVAVPDHAARLQVHAVSGNTVVDKDFIGFNTAALRIKATRLAIVTMDLPAAFVTFTFTALDANAKVIAQGNLSADLSGKAGSSLQVSLDANGATLTTGLAAPVPVTSPLVIEGSPAPLQSGAVYVGAQTCSGCHKDIYNVYAATSHHTPRSTAVGTDWSKKTTSVSAGTVVIGTNNNLPIAASAAPRFWMAAGFIANPAVKPVPTDITETAACVACHVVGEAASSQDVWNPVMFKTVRGAGQLQSELVNGLPAGYDFTKPFDDPANQPFVGVQCENCHGPGGFHVTAKTDADRLNSIVQKPNYKTTCLKCHSSNYMTAWNGSATDADVNVSPVGFSEHTAQGLVYTNEGGFEYNDLYGAIPPSGHQSKLTNGCIECHMVGTAPNDHMVVMSYNRPTDSGYSASYWSADNWDLHLPKCQTCHGKGFSEANVEAFQAETKGMQQALHDALSEFQLAFCQQYYFQSSSNSWPPVVQPSKSPTIGKLEVTGYQCSKWVDGPAGATSLSVNWMPYVTTTPTAYETEYNRARWNYNIVSSDGSKGVHSPAYIQELMRRSYNRLYTVMGTAGFGTSSKPFPSPYPSVFTSTPPSATPIGILSLPEKE